MDWWANFESPTVHHIFLYLYQYTILSTMNVNNYASQVSDAMNRESF